MDNKGGLSFTARKGFFVQRWVAVFILFLFIGSLIAVGLLVHYLAPEHPAPASGDSGHEPEVKPKFQDVRLPYALVPVHYDLKLKPFIGQNDNFTFNGEVSMLVKCVYSTNNVTVHMLNMTIHESTIRVVKMSDNSSLGITKVSYDDDRQFMIVFLKEFLDEGQNYTMTTNYIGILNDNMDGFYRSSYTDAETAEKKWMAVTQFQPTDARRALPCMDEPGLKATFSVTMIRPNNLNSVSNMPIQSTNKIDDEWTEDTFQETKPMSTYLLAFMVSDFYQRVNLGDYRFNFSVYCRKGAENQLDYAVKIGPEIMSKYEAFFNIPYPLPKQDMIALTDFKAGAMENWGLITYRETAVLYDPEVSSASSKQRVAVVIAHELAHQWFGNLVTPEWWDDLWLNEGFASYMEFVGTDMVEPTWQMLDQIVVSSIQSAMGLDALNSSHPVSVPVANPDEINEIFDRISYEKGCAIIRMMASFLGNSTFLNGLSKYLHKYQMANARQDNLWEQMTEAAQSDGKDINVKDVMDTWTLQTGFPVVDVHRNYDKKSVTLTQKRFFLNMENLTENDTKERWWVPLTYTTAKKLDFTTTEPSGWLKPDQTSETIENIDSNENEWVLFNIQQTGFYRVNYDTKNWKLLFDQLQNDHKVISGINRAQLMDDAFNLARSGEMTYDVALNVTLYLKDEADYVPWMAAFNSFTFLDTMLSRSDAYGDFKKYVLQQISPIYDTLQFEESANEEHVTQMLRVLVLSWACAWGHEDCVNKAQTKYKTWMETNDPKPITPNLKRLITCTAIWNGGEKEWDFAWERYKESNVAGEKDILLQALGCTREPWIISRYLEMSISNTSGIRKQDGSTVFRVVSDNAVGRYIAFNFLRDQWATIFQYYGSSFFSLSSMVTAVTNSMNTNYELKEMHEFTKEHEDDMGPGTRTVLQALEGTEANIKFMEAHYHNIKSWFEAQVKQQKSTNASSRRS